MKLLDTSKELVIKPIKNGVKLIRPHRTILKMHISLVTIGQMFQEDYHVFFLDKNSVIQNINDAAINNSGFPPLKRTIGKTVDIILNEQEAHRIKQNDLIVVKQDKMHIFEESFIKPISGFSMSILTFKFPWYNENNEIIGIFGCSTTISSGIAKFLEDIQKLGLLISNQFNSLSDINLTGGEIYGKYLSYQELNCLQLLLKGMTIKKIAANLCLSPRTVEHYLQNIKLKLNVTSTSELIEMLFSLNFS